MAKALLGMELCRRLDDGTVLRARIVETEAYFGEEDTACHAHHGRTPRTDIMYAPGGFAYVYLCYGMHHMLNVVTGPADHPEAVLIRGVEGAVGPGRVTKTLHITRELNRENLVESNRLWIETDGAPPVRFKSSARVGIGYASKRDQARKWRFVEAPTPRIRPRYGTSQRFRFVCRRCGACCRIPDGIVRVSDAEITRIANFLGMPETAFIENETDVAPDRRSLILKSRTDGACAWLTDDNLCRINPVKPDKCRTFPGEWRNSDSESVCPALGGHRMP